MRREKDFNPGGEIEKSDLGRIEKKNAGEVISKSGGLAPGHTSRMQIIHSAEGKFEFWPCFEGTTTAQKPRT